jgi:hypothetical protein
MSQATNCRRFFLFARLLSGESVINTEINAICIKVEFTQSYVLDCYSEMNTRVSDIRSVTHFFPRKINDPVLLGIANTVIQDRIIFSLFLAPEIMGSTRVRTLTYEQTIVFLREFFGHFKPYRPEEEGGLSASSRSRVYYDTERLIRTTNQLSEQWGFNPKVITSSYRSIPVKKSGIKGVSVFRLFSCTQPKILSKARISSTDISIEDDGSSTEDEEDIFSGIDLFHLPPIN